MLEREDATQEPLPSPVFRDLSAWVGRPLVVSTSSGAVSLEPLVPLAHCQGGFFCDEPVRFYDGA